MSENNQPIVPEEANFFRNSTPPFNQSKEDIWKKMEADLQEDKTETKVISIQWSKYAIAASIALLIGISSFLKFHTISVSVANNERRSHTLPDGSKVVLNSASSIAYHPYWWSINREVKLSGEAFFQVQKGSKFKVISTKGSTEVLGTSFNISTRENGYEVYCKTGKVKVQSSENNHSVNILPNQFVSLQNQQLLIDQNKNEKEILGWMNHELNFSSRKFSSVIKELERQFDVSIQLNINDKDFLFSLNGTKGDSIQVILEIIATSTGYVIHENEKSFKISEK